MRTHKKIRRVSRTTDLSVHDFVVNWITAKLTKNGEVNMLPVHDNTSTHPMVNNSALNVGEVYELMKNLEYSYEIGINQKKFEQCANVQTIVLFIETALKEKRHKETYAIFGD